MKSNPTLGEAYRLASEDEQQRSVAAMNKTRVEVAAFQAQQQRKDSSSQSRYKGGSKEQKRNNGSEVDHCTFCGRDGHKREGCFKLVGYPDWWPGKVKQDKPKPKPKPKAACVDADKNMIAGLTEEQYQTLLKHFTGEQATSEGDKITKSKHDWA